MRTVNKIIKSFREKKSLRRTISKRKPGKKNVLIKYKMKIILSIAKTNILNKNKHTKYNFLEQILIGREKPIVGFYQGSHGDCWRQKRTTRATDT